MELIALRHGQSTANAAASAPDGAAERARWAEEPDVDVPLSRLGFLQSERIGQWLAGLPASRRPDLVITSSYRRARQTWQVARAVAEAHGARLPQATVDDRLGDRRMGELELLTDHEVGLRFPDEAARRAGDEVRYRPPGGESFPDISARVGPLLSRLRTQHSGSRVLLVTHDAVVLALRHLIEGQPWPSLLAAGGPANGSATRWVGDGAALRLADYNQAKHLRR
jgi:2,3-bisphosphoglycerate-dependent phosphoglycerate mutase